LFLPFAAFALRWSRTLVACCLLPAES
jgi:hypothetical protein